jgi:carboxypeptidase C (cathepsin A)
MTRLTSLTAGLLAATLACMPVICPAADAPAPVKTGEPAAAPPDSTTDGTLDAGGEHLQYRAVAGTITVGSTDAQDAAFGPGGIPSEDSASGARTDANPKDAPATARMFYVAYFLKNAKPETRPITFLYNGGPGSSTVWLHMGCFGPKHVLTPGDTHLPAAPYRLADNAYSLLDVSDLVFIDAPGTGYSRMFGKDNEKAFWGIDQDANAFARFIPRFLGQYSRWNSPKYLFGESYGTTRSAVLANVLENKKAVDLNGVILLSQIFNFTTDIDEPRTNPGVDLPYELALPTYAATAWYHHKLPQQPPALPPLLTEVESFAMGEYAHALEQGTDLSAAEKQAIAEKLHNYTGLPAAYWVKADLRVSGGAFEKNLQSDDDLTTGRLDTRFSGPTLDPLSEEAGYDPQASAIAGAYVALFNDYAAKVLKYGQGMTYLPEIEMRDDQWNMAHKGDPLNHNVAPDLAMAMKTNPRLKVLVNGGYFDLATPFYAATYEEKHLPIPSNLAGNIQYDWYQSGHMVYVREEALKQLHDNVAAFIRANSAGNQ